MCFLFGLNKFLHVNLTFFQKKYVLKDKTNCLFHNCFTKMGGGKVKNMFELSLSENMSKTKRRFISKTKRSFEVFQGCLLGGCCSFWCCIGLL